MKKVILYVALVLVLIFGISLASCHVFGPESSVGADHLSDIDESNGDHANNEGNHSRRTDLALLKTREAHQIDISDLSQIVLNTFNQTMANQATGRSAITAGKITGTRGVPTNAKNGFEISERFGGGGSRGRSVISSETEVVEVFEFAIGDGADGEWFILASDDMRIGHILAITQESLADSDSEHAAFLRESLNEYIDAVVHEYNDITDNEAEAALNALYEDEIPGIARVVAPGITLNPNDWILTGHSSNLQIQKSPILQTQWGQGSRGYTATGFAYNNYIKHYYRNDPNGQLYLAGCGVTAVAQIIAYHNFMNPNAASRTRTAPAFTDATSSTMNMGTWNGQYNLSTIRGMQTITNTSSAAAKGQVAALMYHVFREIKSDPRPTVTVSQTGSYAPAFRNFGYVILYEGSATTLSGTSNNFSIQYHANLDIIRSAINNNRPILARGGNAAGDIGHVWVIDGYGAVTWIEEYYRHRITGQTTTRRITLNNVLMVHCNMGWDGNNYGYSGWYMYGIFDAAANRNHLNMTDIKSGDRNYSTGTWLVIPRRL
ncbi:MAG: C10 family peptidase [Treponema sp.]|nr:C10 family peptidase [Treponema sp.]